jgi:putative transcription factor
MCQNILTFHEEFIWDYMYSCDICGRQVGKLYVIQIEGAEMAVCGECSEGKNVIDTVGDEPKSRKNETKHEEEPVEELIDNYGSVIRNARERMKIPLTVLAEIINEKESTLLRVEKGKMLPNIELTKKLEKELGIKLTEVAAEGDKTKTKHEGPITLGDAAFKKEHK